jgi:hypothetical protein
MPAADRNWPDSSLVAGDWTQAGVSTEENGHALRHPHTATISIKIERNAFFI